MNNYHYRETLCNDPNKDFEILDYISIRDNSESLEQPTPSLSSKYSTSNTESDINLYDSSYDIQFDTSAIGLAKAYANSSSTSMQERDNKIDINWLAQDLDRYPHSVEKLLKQLRGIWELDFDMVNEIVMKSKGNKSKSNGLNTLGVCKSYFNYDNKQLHKCQKSEVSIDRASKSNNVSNEEFDNSTTKKNKDSKDTNSHQEKSTEEKVAIPTSLSFLGVKIAFRLKKVNVKKLSNSEIYCDIIKKNPKQMDEALATLLWRSRSE
ncbi:8230_t:CDS:2, partial [Gigaspora margarita]